MVLYFTVHLQLKDGMFAEFVRSFIKYTSLLMHSIHTFVKTSARIEKIPFDLHVIFPLQLLHKRQAEGTCLA